MNYAHGGGRLEAQEAKELLYVDDHKTSGLSDLLKRKTELDLEVLRPKLRLYLFTASGSIYGSTSISLFKDVLPFSTPFLCFSSLLICFYDWSVFL